LQMLDTLHQLGDHQFDDWLPPLRQVEAALPVNKTIPLNLVTLNALRPQINTMAQNTLKDQQTLTPWRTAWLGTQMARLHQLLGVVSRPTATP
jgi:hypothetical protein